MAEIVSVAKTTDIPVGQMKKIEKGNKEILLVNVGGKLYAIDDRCGHMNMSLAAGKLTGKHVTCPFHGATFDVTSGKAVARHSEQIDEYVRSMKLPIVQTKDIRSYNVRVQGDYVQIEID